MALKNNVLSYIKQYLGCANSYGLYQGCKILFTDAHINEAKLTLLDTCSTKLNEFDPETLKKVRGAVIILSIDQRLTWKLMIF